MIGYDISRILSLQSAVYRNFIGLFHLNELPEKIGCHNFAVINYSNHWFVIHHNLFDEIEVFNSLGENSSVTSKVKSHFKNAKGFVTNNTQLQSDDCTLCAQFSIFFIVERYYNPDVSFLQFLNEHFSSNQKRNQQRVEKFVKRLENGRRFQSKF